MTIKTTQQVSDDTGISVTTLAKYARQFKLSRTGNAYTWTQRDIDRAVALYTDNTTNGGDTLAIGRPSQTKTTTKPNKYNFTDRGHATVPTEIVDNNRRIIDEKIERTIQGKLTPLYIPGEFTNLRDYRRWLKAQENKDANT